MCRVFVGADPSLWESQTRSIRMDGMVTSIRLERLFWTVLDEIAVKGELTVPQLLHQLTIESIDAGHDLGNFTSFLRVCCLRFTDLQAQGLPSGRAGDDRPADGSCGWKPIIAGRARRGSRPGCRGARSRRGC